MSEQFDEQFEEGVQQSPSRRYMWIGIIVAIIAAIAIPTILVMRSNRSDVTLETINDRLNAIEANLDGDIAAAKTDLAWVKEKIADLMADAGELDSDLAGVVNKLNSVETKVSGMETDLTTLASAVDDINTTLASCNCTCEGA